MNNLHPAFYACFGALLGAIIFGAGMLTGHYWGTP